MVENKENSICKTTPIVVGIRFKYYCNSRLIESRWLRGIVAYLENYLIH